MRVLAIESSCDETAAAVVSVSGGAAAMDRGWAPVVEAEVVASQVATHRRYGGVVPELASRAHLEAVLPAVREAMERAGVGPGDLDLVAATRGPGLIGALLVGMETAKALAFAWRKPLVPVHHLAGHVLAAWLVGEGERPEPPFLCLLVSGGHTTLYEVLGPTDLRPLGQTRDDAAGEAFDKGARMLGLPYPGGAEIGRLATGGDPRAVVFPVPMRRSGDLDFSFSGLKTALKQHLAARGGPPEGAGLADLCASYQEAIADALLLKTRQALAQTRDRRLVVVGGVAANRRLRARLDALAGELRLRLHLAPLAYCTDNAAMIGVAALALPPSAHLAARSPEAMALDCHPSSPLGAWPPGDAPR